MDLGLQLLGFVPLWHLALPPCSCCTFHSSGHCKGRTFRIAPWSVALGVLGVGLALGWRALVPVLPGSSFEASSQSLPFFCIPPTWHCLPSVPFPALPHLPSSRICRCWLLPWAWGSGGRALLKVVLGIPAGFLTRCRRGCWPPWVRWFLAG